MGALEGGIARFLRSRSRRTCYPEDTLVYKALTDARGYRRIVLPNAVQVLLISDPDTDKAAASVDVHVVSFCDPEELPGLALWNTCFTFPVRSIQRRTDFLKFLAAHGDATSREIRAVDSEKSRNFKDDVYRLFQHECHFTSKDYPLHKLAIGNLETLGERPKAKGLDTRAEMLKFYGDHCSSNLMCLAIYGKESLDELQTLAKDKFCAVKDSDLQGGKDSRNYWSKSSSRMYMMEVTSVLNSGHRY